MALIRDVRLVCDTDDCSEQLTVPEEGLAQPFIWAGKQGWTVEVTPGGSLKTYCPRFVRNAYLAGLTIDHIWVTEAAQEVTDERPHETR